MNRWIAVNPKICSGKPVVRGTRILVRNILGMMAAGYATEKVLRAFPELTEVMVQGVLRDVAAVVDERRIVLR